jgi:hypothetical protein
MKLLTRVINDYKTYQCIGRYTIHSSAYVNDRILSTFTEYGININSCCINRNSGVNMSKVTIKTDKEELNKRSKDDKDN